MAKRCNLGNHEVKHEFLYLPDCPVGLMGRDLLCNLRAQITFYSDGTMALKLRRPEEKTLILMLHEKRNGDSMTLKGGLLRLLRFPARFQVYGLKINSQTWPKMCPQYWWS
jgi:hypothetical protein